MCCLSSIRQTPPGQLPEHNCFEPVVAWIRACEADEGVQKVLALALAFFVSLILCVSVFGAPLFFMAHEEYVLQEVEPRFASERVEAMRQLTATNEDQAKQISWLSARQKPDSDDANIVPFENIVLQPAPPTAAQGSTVPPPPAKEDLIQILKTKNSRLELENRELRIQLAAAQENPLGIKAVPLDKAQTLARLP